MMSAKLATPGLLKIKIFKNKGCDVINVPQIILYMQSCDQNLITLAFL